MKKITLFLILLMLANLSYGQVEFKWDVIDSISKPKDLIYSETKMFIAEFWKSAQDVIQNDDKDGGMILIKGESLQSSYFQMHDHNWTFSYTVKFMMRDNKFRIIIENVYCSSARCSDVEWPKMPVGDLYPVEKGMRKTGLNEERYLEIMKSLKIELQNIVDRYQVHIKGSNKQKEDW